jgi:lipopolysaccharide biosynthesis glycosyltransferase
MNTEPLIVANQSQLNESHVTAVNNQEIVVVCAADNRYAMQVAVTIRSILENLSNDRKLVQFIIDGGINKHNKRKILNTIDSERCELKWISNPDALLENIQVLRDFSIGNNLAEPKHITIAAYYRILIPELLPHNYKKAIYLDSDLIVNSDLGQLWDIDMGENYLLAIQDQGSPYVSSPAGLINYQELGISPNAKYFNSGVLVIDLEKWRANNISSQALEYLRNKRELIRWHDQDALNIVLAGKWKDIHPRWNQMPEIFDFSFWQESPFPEDVYNDVVHSPFIIHFAIPAKPWNSRTTHPANNLYFQYLDKTAWRGWRNTIWRRLWRRLAGEIKQLFHKFISRFKSS